MRRALISVADKSGLIELAAALLQAGYEIISSSGTGQELGRHKIACKEISDITKFPEIMDGRVKTLHPLIHGGILGRRDQDAEVMQQQHIVGIDMVIVNLYPFAQTLADNPDDHELLIENIDIGGPALLRAAAKNHRWVTAIVDPADYLAVIRSLAKGGPDMAMRERLAAKTYGYTSGYDALIAKYLEDRSSGKKADDTAKLNVQPSYATPLKYGENPHQRGVLYAFDKASGWGGVQIHQGKALSYNNIADADAAWRCMGEFNRRPQSTPTCVIIKHASPCGIARAGTLEQAYMRAYKADCTSAFGGVIALNGECDAPTAQAIITNQFAEIIVAPSFAAAALAAYRDKKPNIRLISLPAAGKHPHPPGQMRSVAGGVLWQSDNVAGFDPAKVKQVAGSTPMPIEELRFAWLVVKHLKSNAMVFTSNQQTIGIGAGQTSRIGALRQAVQQAQAQGFDTTGCVLASDAFIPFSDTIEIAASCGVGWIIQSGGSKRDEEVIAAAQAHGIGMALTGERHFYH